MANYPAKDWTSILVRVTADLAAVKPAEPALMTVSKPALPVPAGYTPFNYGRRFVVVEEEE